MAEEVNGKLVAMNAMAVQLLTVYTVPDHHNGESSLAACVGVDRLQDRCADVQSSSWRCTALSGATHLCRWPSQSPGSAVGCHQLLGCAIRQTVNCRQPSFSGCRPPDLEFFTGAHRSGSNTPVLQETLENILTLTIVLTSTLMVLEVTLVT